MDSRDILIIGAVAVAAFLYFRHNQPQSAGLPTTGPLGTTGGAAMTNNAAMNTTPPLRQPVINQIGAALSRGFSGFSALSSKPLQFAGSTAYAVIADRVDPSPVVRPPVVSTATLLGGAAVFGSGAGSMGPQPATTHVFEGLSSIVNPVRY